MHSIPDRYRGRSDEGYEGDRYEDRGEGYDDDEIYEDDRYE